MISLSVTPGDRETSYYTKTGSEIQSGVHIHDTSIFGTLNKLEDYKTFDQDTAQHHLVLKFSAKNADKLETKMTGGSLVMKDYVTVDDGFCVYSVTEPETQKVYVKATKNGNSVEEIYDLSGLVLADE